MGTDENQEFIIGIVRLGYLRPFMALRAEFQNSYVKVKIRINSNEIVPILPGDPANNLFFKVFGRKNIRIAEIQN